MSSDRLLLCWEEESETAKTRETHDADQADWYKYQGGSQTQDSARTSNVEAAAETRRASHKTSCREDLGTTSS